MTKHTQSIFNPDFFPTPDFLIEQITDGLDLFDKCVLEPSAGSGSIVDYLIAKGARHVLACEINDELATIVKRKATFLKSDFLKVTPAEISHIDAIVMNPPFSADEKHIIHAFEIAPDGCEIRAICNWQTLFNPYTAARKQLQSLISNYGSADYLGSPFMDAERKTDAEIGFVVLKKPAAKNENEFAEYFSDEYDAVEHSEEGLVRYNEVRDIVNRYVSTLRLYDQVLEIGVQMNTLMNGIYLEKKSEMVFTCSEGEVPVTRERFEKELQKASWSWIINKMNLQKYSTRGLMADINKYVEQQQKLRFTMINIYRMLDLIVQTAGQRMDKALLEVFENLTKHYHENRYSVEGWKTNSHYLVNRKFIKPYVAPESKWGFMDINYRACDTLDDLDKALCFITGTPWGDTRRLYPVISKAGKIWGEWFDWGFFQVKLFKKGTGHFVFKDENVWALFNQQIARIQGFPLPESIKSKTKNQ